MPEPIHSTHTVAQVLDSWPQVIPIFIRRRMSCVGCSMSRFTTLRDASQVYRLDLAQFLEELNRVAAGGIDSTKPKETVS